MYGFDGTAFNMTMYHLRLLKSTATAKAIEACEMTSSALIRISDEVA